jgi:hypothetical protein
VKQKFEKYSFLISQKYFTEFDFGETAAIMSAPAHPQGYTPFARIATLLLMLLAAASVVAAIATGALS